MGQVLPKDIPEYQQSKSIITKKALDNFVKINL